MTALENALRRLTLDLAALNRNIALVGGLAVSVRSEPRFTRDIDLAVVVSDDAAAEALAHTLQNHGYRILTTVEQTERARLATVRLDVAKGGARGVVADLLFASSGIETEIVDLAEELEVFPGLSVPVAQVGHLLALKLLARDDRRRPQDLVDIRALLGVATQNDLALARSSAALIEERGFSRGRNLQALLDDVLA